MPILQVKLPFRFWIETIRITLSPISGGLKPELAVPPTNQNVTWNRSLLGPQSPGPLLGSSSGDGCGKSLAANSSDPVASSSAGGGLDGAGFQSREASALDAWVRSETAELLESSAIGRLAARLAEQDLTVPLLMALNEAELLQAAGSMGTFVALRNAVERARLPSVMRPILSLS